jgi:hypothetical protein
VMMKSPMSAARPKDKIEQPDLLLGYDLNFKTPRFRAINGRQPWLYLHEI